MLIYQKGPIRAGEVWFDGDFETEGVDVINFVQRSRPLPGSSYIVKFTIHIDLSQTEDQLLADMPSNTRYKVRRAIKEGIIYDAPDPKDPDVLAEFCEFHDRFSQWKSQGWLDAIRNGFMPLDQEHLARIADSGHLDLSRIKSPEGSDLTWHAHYRAGGTCNMFRSATNRERDDSSYRVSVGRANRAHHWFDMQRFKKEGEKILDMGGWYHGFDDEARMRIAEFKSEFGGRITRGVDASLGVTPKGKLLVRSRHIAKKSMGREVRIAP